MRIDCKTLRLSVCLFVLLCLSSVGYASQPSSDVHFCLPLNFEDMRARDSSYAATKHALNLNVGEPRTVRMIYFLPNDRPFQQAIVDSMKVTIRQVQTFFADQMEAHGYGRKTFRFETDAQGKPPVHRMEGQHPNSHYYDETFKTVFEEIEQAFDVRENIYFIVIDNGTNSIGSIGQSARGAGSRMGKNGGITLFPGEFIWHVVAHELGHAFGSSHDFRDNAYIMSYGAGRNRLSICHAEYLTVHPYFNPNIPIEEAQSPTIELISSPAYPPDSKSVSIQLKVSDSEGLHQILLFVKTIRPHIAAGFDEVKTCRGLVGEKDIVIEFEYDGVIPSVTETSLSNPVLHPIYVEVVDTDGNVGKAFFDLLEISPHHIAVFEGHTSLVVSVAFSPDSTTIASGSWDKTIQLWDVATKRNIGTLEGDNVSIRALAFSPDGTILASNAFQGVKLWEISTQKEIATFKGHTSRVTSVAFSPDGTTLASGSWDDTVKLWDIKTGTNTATLEGHTFRVNSIAFSSDGTTLASGSSDDTVKLWDVATSANIFTLESHTSWVSSVAFSSDGITLASGSSDDTVKLWDVVTGENIATLEGHTERVTSVAFSPDGTTLASGSYDDTIKLWDVVTRHNIATLLGYTKLINSVAYSPDGTRLIVGTGGYVVELWDMSEWMQPRPQTLVKISGDNQQGTPGAELANPFIVEVRDQYGNPLQGTAITFTTTTGDGKLSGRFTVEKVITDANGRAQSTLMLGSNPEKNTVEVSVAGVKVSFNAVGIGTSTTSITDGSYQTWSLPDGAMFRLGKGRIRGTDRAVAYSPDGRSLAVASSIGIYLYDVATLRELALFTGHTSWVESVAFSPDGKMLASGSADRTVKLWDIATRTNIATFEGHTDRLESVAFSPDGKILASGARDNTIRLWDVETRENIATLEGHTNLVWSVVFSPDSKILASGSEDDTVKLWDVETRENIATFETHTYRVWSVAFSPDGTILAAGSWDEVKLWDVATGTNIATFETPQAESVAFSPDGRSLAAASSIGVYLYDVVTFHELALFTGDTYGVVQSVAFSPDGSTLASTLLDNRVTLWDVATHNHTILKHTYQVVSVAFSPDGTTLIWGAKNYRVNLWDVINKKNITTLKGDAGFDSISPDGKTLALGTGHEIWLWDLATGENIAMFKGHRSPVIYVSFSPDGTTLASGSWNGPVKLWDVATKENIATLIGHTSRVNFVAFSPDGTILASGSSDKTIKLWDVKRKENIATFEEHTTGVNSVAYSPDGMMLASGVADGTILLWDVAEEKNIATLEARNLVYSVVFSPDGAILASGSANGTILLWDVSTGQSVATFTGHTESIGSIAFSPEGTKLASGSGDGTALLWDVSSYITPVVYIPDANLRAVIRSALGKSRFAPITTTDIASLTTLDASNRNIRDLTGLEFATNLTELNLVDNPLSALAINTDIPALQDRGIEVLFDKPTTPDFDGDGVVGIADFLLFVEQFGFSEDDAGYDARFDLDGDGIIGIGDFLIFANAFGKEASSN